MVIEKLIQKQKKETQLKRVELSQKLMAVTKAFIQSSGLNEDESLSLMEKTTHFNEEINARIKTTNCRVRKKNSSALLSLPLTDQ